MGQHDNRRLTGAIYDAFNRNDLDAVIANATDDISVAYHPTGETFTGRDGFRVFLQTFKTAMPDATLTITNQIVTDDAVANVLAVRGTHTGPLAGPGDVIPATGKLAAWSACEIWKVRDGKLAAVDNFQDTMTLLRQLGLILDSPEGGI